MTEKIYTLRSPDIIVAFWEKEVATKLDAQQMILRFVANDAPDELEPVVKFLQDWNRH